VETGADIVSGNWYVVLPRKIKKQCEPEYKDQHEMLLKVLSPRSNTHTIWRRLINIRLYRDYKIGPKEGVDFNEDVQQMVKLTYYADKVSQINDYIYFYGSSNNYSYSNSLINHPSVQLWEQAVESSIMVETFFSDKEQVYRNLARRYVIHSMKIRMSLAARFRERAFFEKMKSRITTEYADCYDEIGWNNPTIRAFMSNYALNGAYRRFLNAL
jgi:hypothetical protein